MEPAERILAKSRRYASLTKQYPFLRWHIFGFGLLRIFRWWWELTSYLGDHKIIRRRSWNGGAKIKSPRQNKPPARAMFEPAFWAVLFADLKCGWKESGKPFVQLLLKPAYWVSQLADLKRHWRERNVNGLPTKWMLLLVFFYGFFVDLFMVLDVTAVFFVLDYLSGDHYYMDRIFVEATWKEWYYVISPPVSGLVTAGMFVLVGMYAPHRLGYIKVLRHLRRKNDRTRLVGERQETSFQGSDGGTYHHVSYLIRRVVEWRPEYLKAWTLKGRLFRTLISGSIDWGLAMFITYLAWKAKGFFYLLSFDVLLADVFFGKFAIWFVRKADKRMGGGLLEEFQIRGFGQLAYAVNPVGTMFRRLSERAAVFSTTDAILASFIIAVEIVAVFFLVYWFSRYLSKRKQKQEDA